MHVMTRIHSNLIKITILKNVHETSSEGELGLLVRLFRGRFASSEASVPSRWHQWQWFFFPQVSEALLGRPCNAMQDARISGRRPDSEGQFGTSGAGEKPPTKVDGKAGRTTHDLSASSITLLQWLQRREKAPSSCRSLCKFTRLAGARNIFHARVPRGASWGHKRGNSVLSCDVKGCD